MALGAKASMTRLGASDPHLSKQQVAVQAAGGTVSVTRLGPNPSFLQRTTGARATPLRRAAH